eukprot:1160519-Pelagomonas_calceolata.AAC.9
MACVSEPQAFQRMMEEELKVVAAKEAEEAEEEAGDKEDREMFEQRWAKSQRGGYLSMCPNMLRFCMLSAPTHSHCI